ncbi:hypothetical protein ACFL5Z_18420 [Planctomycetota bacterium]
MSESKKILSQVYRMYGCDTRSGRLRRESETHGTIAAGDGASQAVACRARFRGLYSKSPQSRMNGFAAGYFPVGNLILSMQTFLQMSSWRSGGKHLAI